MSEHVSLFLGGINTASLTKFLQADDLHLKMAIVTDKSRFIIPEHYFPVSYGQVADLQLESAAVSGQVKPSARMDVGLYVD